MSDEKIIFPSENNFQNGISNEIEEERLKNENKKLKSDIISLNDKINELSIKIEKEKIESEKKQNEISEKYEKEIKYLKNQIDSNFDEKNDIASNFK